MEADVGNAQGEQAARAEHAVGLLQDGEWLARLVDDVDQGHRVDRPAPEGQQRAVGPDRRDLAAPARRRARLMSQVGVHREPATRAREPGQVAAAAHVEKARRIATEAKTRQPVEERVEEARPLRGEAVRREAQRIVPLVVPLELRARGLHRRQRAPAASAPVMPHAAVDELAETSRPAAGGTGGRRAAWGRVHTRRRLVPPSARDAPQRVLEVGGRARPRVAPLAVRSTRRAQPLVALRIARLVVEEALEARGEHFGRRAAEDQGWTERREDLGRRADRRPENGRAAGERLHRDEPEALELAGRQHERVRRLVVERKRLVGHEAQELHVRLEAERVALRLEKLGERAGPPDQQERVGPPRLHDRHRAQQAVETHARLEVPDREQERPVRRNPELAPDRAAIGRRLEPLRRRRAGDHDDPVPRHGVELPDLVGREVAEDVDQRDPPQAGALERPQHRDARRAHEPRAVPVGHPAPRAVFERRRRVEAVEARKPAGRPGGERAVPRERLVQMQDVRTLPRQLVRRRPPGPENGAPDESRDRSPVHRERPDADALPLERARRVVSGIGAAHDTHRVTARGELPSLLPEHALSPARGRGGRHVGDHEDTERVVHARLTRTWRARAGRGTRASTLPPSSASRGGRRGFARRSGAPA